MSTTLLKQLEKHRKAIGKERDALREMQQDIESLLEDCDQGLASLEDAIEIFSRQT